MFSFIYVILLWIYLASGLYKSMSSIHLVSFCPLFLNLSFFLSCSRLTKASFAQITCNLYFRHVPQVPEALHFFPNMSWHSEDCISIDLPSRLLILYSIICVLHTQRMFYVDMYFSGIFIIFLIILDFPDFYEYFFFIYHTYIPPSTHTHTHTNLHTLAALKVLL